jgi:RNA polymerase sigma factor (sigma-70 family)
MAANALRIALSFASQGDASDLVSREGGRRPLADGGATTDLDALLTAIAHESRSAFDTLHAALHGELWHFARSIVRDADLASDVVQDVFVDLWNRRQTLSVHGSVRGYFFGATRHRALHLMRSAAARDRTVQRFSSGREPDALIQDAPDHATEQADVIAILRRAIDALPERQRSAMLLRWNTSLNAAEIGRALGVSDTAARKLLAKGEATLREVYERAAR